jgi:hypothetical protein
MMEQAALEKKGELPSESIKAWSNGVRNLIFKLNVMTSHWGVLKAEYHDSVHYLQSPH